MTKTTFAMLAIAALAGAAVLVPTHAEGATAPMLFGMDSGSLAAQKAAGVAPNYGTMWIGPWTLTSGWGGPDAQLDAMKAAGVTPVVHLYYWGDDISPSCVKYGCWSDLHDTQKTQAGWQKLTDQLIAHLKARMAGKPVVVILESEFNKGGIESYEGFDGLLATKANQLRAGYPAAQVVLGFGNWNRAAWGMWDRAAAASQYIGVQGMRGSTRDSDARIADVYEETLAGAVAAKSLFGKPVLVTDIAVSSYPEPTYAARQDAAVKEILSNIPALKAAGVKGLLYRSWKDDPKMDLGNYYGEAERHWGLAWTSGAQKDAGKTWVAAVKKERAAPVAAAATVTATASYVVSLSATFTPKSVGNDWWVETKVTSATGIAKVEAKVNGGAWTALPATGWGTWAKSLNAPNGAQVQFRATGTNGATSTSPVYTWT